MGDVVGIWANLETRPASFETAALDAISSDSSRRRFPAGISPCAASPPSRRNDHRHPRRARVVGSLEVRRLYVTNSTFSAVFWPERGVVVVMMASSPSVCRVQKAGAVVRDRDRDRVPGGSPGRQGVRRHPGGRAAEGDSSNTVLWRTLRSQI